MQGIAEAAGTTQPIDAMDMDSDDDDDSSSSSSSDDDENDEHAWRRPHKMKRAPSVGERVPEIHRWSDVVRFVPSPPPRRHQHKIL